MELQKDRKISVKDTFLKVFKNIASLQATSHDAETHIVTIGNFDGCHLGHQKLIELTLDLAKQQSSFGMALSFDPHPKYFFNPGLAPTQLFTMNQKIRAFAEMGLDRLLIQSFDEEFRVISASDFYHSYLRKALKAKGIVIGHNFYFGKAREGSPESLRTMAAADGVILQLAEPSCYQEGPISSTRIRNTLTETGNVSEVWSMLGRPYCLEGRCHSGQKIGRKLGFPTINLGQVEQATPRNGVYAALVWLEGISEGSSAPLMRPNLDRLLPAVVNIGHRPTLQNDQSVVVEAHLLSGHPNLPQDLEQRPVAVYFSQRLRDELKFANADELKAQIEQDIAIARRLF